MIKHYKKKGKYDQGCYTMSRYFYYQMSYCDEKIKINKKCEDG